MIEKKGKRKKISFEILLTLGVCLGLSILLFLFVTIGGRNLIDGYCFYNDIVLDEFEIYHLDATVMVVGVAVSSLFFFVTFWAMFCERIVYIRKITAGVHQLMEGNYGEKVAIEGNNELTQLAEAVNFLSEGEQRIKEKEKKLREEKEEFIRALSHDIRTPLTLIIAYTQLLQKKDTLTESEKGDYLALVDKKTSQIKELTDILLDGGKREPEYFEDARLLFQQLADEFESRLEGDFKASADVASLPSFGGCFDVGELMRVFDNLISNIIKYADREGEVQLSVSKNDEGVVIRQKNAIKTQKASEESYKMGINSIRRIAQSYGGSVEVKAEDDIFEITVILSDVL